MDLSDRRRRAVRGARRVRTQRELDRCADLGSRRWSGLGGRQPASHPQRRVLRPYSDRDRPGGTGVPIRGRVRDRRTRRDGVVGPAHPELGDDLPSARVGLRRAAARAGVRLRLVGAQRGPAARDLFVPPGADEAPAVVVDRGSGVLGVAVLRLVVPRVEPGCRGLRARRRRSPAGIVPAEVVAAGSVVLGGCRRLRAHMLRADVLPALPGTAGDRGGSGVDRLDVAAGRRW